MRGTAEPAGANVCDATCPRGRSERVCADRIRPATRPPRA